MAFGGRVLNDVVNNVFNGAGANAIKSNMALTLSGSGGGIIGRGARTMMENGGGGALVKAGARGLSGGVSQGARAGFNAYGGINDAMSKLSKQMMIGAGVAGVGAGLAVAGAVGRRREDDIGGRPY